MLNSNLNTTTNAARTITVTCKDELKFMNFSYRGVRIKRGMLYVNNMVIALPRNGIVTVTNGNEVKVSHDDTYRNDTNMYTIRNNNETEVTLCRLPVFGPLTRYDVGVAYMKWTPTAVTFVRKSDGHVIAKFKGWYPGDTFKVSSISVVKEKFNPAKYIHIEEKEEESK